MACDLVNGKPAHAGYYERKDGLYRWHRCWVSAADKLTAHGPVADGLCYYADDKRVNMRDDLSLEWRRIS